MAKAAVAREKLFTLRETIAKLEGKPAPALVPEGIAPGGFGAEEKETLPSRLLATGIADLDKAMQGGLRVDALTEIRCKNFRNAAAATGFTLALAACLRQGKGTSSPVLWIGDRLSALEEGLPYAVGLRDYGLEPQGFLHALPRKLEEALWLAEAALASAAFAVVILEVCGNPTHFGLTESRRLSLRAKAAERPLFLLRQAGEEEASSAFFRLNIESAPAAARKLPDGSLLGGSIGNPVFHLTLEKSRNPAPFSLTLEWNPHDRQFLPVLVPKWPAFPREQSAYPGADLPASADRSDRPQALGTVLAFDRAS